MSSASRVKAPLTLEEFLRLPEIDEHPYLEYIDGKIEAKVSPQKKHSLIQSQIMRSLDDFAKPSSLGLAFPELRCTFAGRSIVPDVVFLLASHVDVDSEGELVDETFRPPDIHIEIGSPDQPAKRNRERLLFSTARDVRWAGSSIPSGDESKFTGRVVLPIDCPTVALSRAIRFSSGTDCRFLNFSVG